MTISRNLANTGQFVSSTGQVSLATGVTDNLPVTNLAGGTGATSSTFWRGDGSWASAQAFASGTKLLFPQTSAPTGWTKDTTNYNNHALRVVTGAASSGGTVDFTTAFTSQGVSGTNASTTATNQSTTATNLATTATNQATTQGGSVSTSTSVSLSAGGSVSSTTLVESQIPSHTHTLNTVTSGTYGFASASGGLTSIPGTRTTSATGGSGSHTHGFTNPSYSASSSSSFTGSSHNHTQDAHNHTQNAHTHTQDAHTHTFTGTAINLAVKYLDVILATKD